MFPATQMTSVLAYELGRSIGKLKVMVEKSVSENREDVVEPLKIKYTFIMDNLLDYIDYLDKSKVSDITLQDVTDELERLIDIYGEIKYDEELPRGQRFIGGFKKKFSLMRQSRRTIKAKDLEILLQKLILWDDRLTIVFSS